MRDNEKGKRPNPQSLNLTQGGKGNKGKPKKGLGIWKFKKWKGMNK